MDAIITRLLDEIKQLHAQQLQDTQNRMQSDDYQSDNVTDLVAALSKAQGEYPLIGADRENPYFKSNYADLNMILRAIRPALAKNGLSLTQDTRFTPDGATILHTRLWHSTGQWIETRARVVPAKNDIQTYGSTLTYNKRYQAMAILGVTIDKDPSDDDAEVAMVETRNIIAKGPSVKYNPKEQSTETITKEQLDELEYELAGAPDLGEMVLDKLQLQSLADMPKSKYMVSLQRIREIKATRNGAR